MSTAPTLERVRPGRERTATGRAVCAAPIEAVWELATDPDRFAAWADRTLEVTRADRPLRLGSTYEERNRVMGPLAGTSRWIVVEHEPPRRTTHRGEGIALAAAMDFFLELSPTADGSATEASVGLRYRPGLGPLGALADRAYLHRSLKRSFERTAASLAALVARERGG